MNTLQCKLIMQKKSSLNRPQPPAPITRYIAPARKSSLCGTKEKTTTKKTQIRSSANSLIPLSSTKNSIALSQNTFPILRDHVIPKITNPPITPQEAISQFPEFLTNYEKEEILNYPDIYFIGDPLKKIKPKKSSTNPNYGFDYATHHYRVTVSDHICYRYEIKSILGKGAFGQVLKCFDHKTQETVALKILINTEQMKTQGNSEINILKILNEKDVNGNSHILKIFDSFEFRSHICFSFELLGQNLYDYCKTNSFKPWSIRQIRTVMRQVFIALAYTHASGFVHCDIKPENILFLPNSTTKIRLIDYGTACKIGEPHFNYIQSRYYRAPEVILGLQFGPPIDIWSVGCMIAELVKGTPMFQGENEVHQLQLHMTVLGMPPLHMITKSPRKQMFFDENNKPLRGTGHSFKVGGSTISKSTTITDKKLLDLLKGCLEWDPNKRLTAEQALHHPFFQECENVVKAEEIKRSQTPTNTGRKTTSSKPVSKK
ncbi:CMGC family protein kinase [Histomonas meleagridis]|uniref:CMGC family protein kinase n=1 Tax=Histomonas meleagridis TaxID=135588 RepID=UPI00355A822E|nr:CMGC family protein kinase [Histomonas meleagridis]KAH0800038.1 CMGC family protein kinase [Histomonas meleagridis]